MVKLGASTILDKKVRPDTNCLPYRRRSPPSKPEKESRGTWEPSSRGGISIAVSGKNKRGASRLGASRGCWITRLEIIAADVDNLGNLTILFS